MQNLMAKAATALGLSLLLTNLALAIDPPYQANMQRLVQTVGSLYFLEPLCGDSTDDWRQQAADLIAADNPDEDRKARLYGAFNQGYEAYARLYRNCTPSAREAMAQLLVEAERLARDIHTRYAE